jgi:predicted dehydrogenase
MAELCSHQLNAANWFLGSSPDAVSATGGLYRFKGDGREVHDHVYATFEYPGGQTAVFSSIESNAFDDYYEMFMGTKGTLILRREIEALFFEEGSGENGPTVVTAAPQTDAAVAQSSETQVGNTNQAAVSGPSNAAPLFERPRSTRLQIQRFCSAIRVGTPLACGPEKAMLSARACIRANESIKQKARLSI